MSETVEFIACAAILGLAVFIHMSVGFGSALWAVPALLWLGLAHPQAVPMVSTSAMIAAIMGTRALREHIKWRHVIPVVVGVALFMPVGVGMAWLMHEHLNAEIRQLVGGVLVAILIAQQTIHPRPRGRLHWGWGVLAGGMGSVLSGLCGMGGPPVALWVLAHDNWSARQMRGVLIFSALISTSMNLLWYALIFPDIAPAAIGRSLWCTPVLIVCTLLGIWAGGHMNRQLLCRVMVLILWLMGIASIVTPWLVG